MNGVRTIRTDPRSILLVLVCAPPLVRRVWIWDQVLLAVGYKPL